jgi:hypothetical protein
MICLLAHPLPCLSRHSMLSGVENARAVTVGDGFEGGLRQRCVENVDGLSKRERGLGRDREKKEEGGVGGGGG